MLLYHFACLALAKNDDHDLSTVSKVQEFYIGSPETKKGSRGKNECYDSSKDRRMNGDSGTNKSHNSTTTNDSGTHNKSTNEILSSTPFEKNKVSLIIANTVKGKGISFMENEVVWHHKVPSEEQYNLAQKELEKLKININND